MDFLEQLQQRVIVGDGAMATELFARGVSRGVCLEDLCVTDPEKVLAVYSDTLGAGAMLIRTNSFGANALRLAPHGFDRRVSEINWTAAQLARDFAKGHDLWVAGSVGPLGQQVGDARELFLEQIGALLDGGIRIIFLETFTDIREIEAALEAKHTLHHCPVIASLAPQPDGTLAGGLPLETAFRRLLDAGADVVGVNCVTFNDALASAFEAVSPALPRAVFESAGIPTEADGTMSFPVKPEAFGVSSVALARRGANLIGGCCGAGPSHIAAVDAALRQAGIISPS